MKTPILKLFAAFTLLFFSSTVFSATKTWVGGTSSAWNLAANWTGGLPVNGDDINIGVATFTTAPIISVASTFSPKSITIGNFKATTLTINAGITLTVPTLTMTATSNAGKVSALGTLDVNTVTMSSGSGIILGAAGTIKLSGNISGGALDASANGSMVILDGTTAAQTFPNSTTISGTAIDYLDIANTFYGSSTNRGVTLTGASVNQTTLEANAIFNANGSLSPTTGYILTMKANSDYISASSFSFRANDVIDVTSTVEFTSASQTVNLITPNAGQTNMPPNVIFTGTTISVKSTTTTAFVVRGNLTCSGSNTIAMTGISSINIQGDFLGTSNIDLTTNSVPLTIEGSWLNTASDATSKAVTYDGNVAGNTQIVSTAITYGSTLTMSNASPKKINSGTLAVTGAFSTSGGAIDMATNTPTVNLNSTWTNTATVTQATGTITSKGTITNSGTISMSGGTITQTYNGAVFTNSGTLNLSNSSKALFPNSGNGVNFTNSGPLNVSSSSNFNISGNDSKFNNTAAITVNAATFGYATSAGGTLTFNNTSPGSITATNSAVLNFLSGSTETYTNTGTISATSSPITFGTGNATLNNSGSLTVASTSLIFNSAGSTVNNTGTFNASLSTLNFGSGTTTYTKINNTTPGTFTASGCTISTGQNSTILNSSSNPFTLQASGTTATTLTLAYGVPITNSGTFYCGKSNSQAVINMATQSSSITNSSYFYVGSTSAINPTATSVSITNSGYFVIQSDEYGSGAIGQLGSSSSYTGTFYVQRFITGGTGYRGYRLLSVPVVTAAAGTSNSLAYINTSQTINAITYNGALTGGPNAPTNGFSVTNSNPTIYLYNDSKLTDNKTFVGGKTIGITKISGTTLTTLSGTTPGSTTLSYGNGYIFYFIGNNAIPLTTASSRVPENTTITALGYLNANNIPVTLYATGSTSLYNGYNLVGNPYACTIDLQAVYTGNSSVYSFFYELDNMTQDYVYYIPSSGATSSSRASRFIASGQGFFVKTTGGSQTLTFKENQKVSSQQLSNSSTPFLLESAPKKQEVFANNLNGANLKVSDIGRSFSATENTLTGMHIKMAKDSILSDECGIYFNKNWDDKFDDNDAFDQDGASPKTFMSSYSIDGVRTAVNSLSDYKLGKRIKLYVKSKVDGQYNLSINDIENIDTVNYKINLVDHFKNDSLDIGKYKTYAFNLVNADTTTYGAGRFELVISQLPTSKYQLASFTAQKASDGVLVTWRAYNEGKNYAFTLEKQDANGTSYSPLYDVQSNGGTIYKYTDKTPNKGNNVYRLKQVDLFGNITYTGPVSVYYDQDATEGMFTLYPNPTVETLHVNVTYSKTNNTLGKYDLKIFDLSGSVVMQKTSDNTSWTENVSKYNPGVYIVELRNNDGTSLGKAKFVKK